MEPVMQTELAFINRTCQSSFIYSW